MQWAGAYAHLTVAPENPVRAETIAEGRPSKRITSSALLLTPGSRIDPADEIPLGSE
jgi:hypothetical protein